MGKMKVAATTCVLAGCIFYQAPIVQAPEMCTLAQVSKDKTTVTLDWSCIDKLADAFDLDDNTEIMPTVAFVFRAIRDGKTVAR